MAKTRVAKKPAGTGAGHVQPLQAAEERGDPTAAHYLTGIVQDDGREQVDCHIRHEDEGGPMGTEVVSLPFRKLKQRATNAGRKDGAWTKADIVAELELQAGFTVEED